MKQRIVTILASALFSPAAIAVTVTLVFVGAQPVQAQFNSRASQSEQTQPNLPTAASVINRHIKALGGRSALRAVRSVTIQTRLTAQSATRIDMVDTVLRQSGNQIKMDMLLSSVPLPKPGSARAPGSGTSEKTATNTQTIQVQMGSDGKTPWTIQPGSAESGGGPRLLEGEKKSDFAEQFSQLFPPLGWENYDGKITVVSTEIIDGRKCYRLAFAPTQGNETVRLFDAETGLIAKLETTEHNEQGTQTVEIIPSDYRKIEGIMIPMKQTNKVDATTVHVMETLAVRFNSKFPQNTFRLPEKIQTLVNRRNRQQSTAPGSAAPRRSDR